MTDWPLTMWYFSYHVLTMLILLGSVDLNFMVSIVQAALAVSVVSIAICNLGKYIPGSGYMLCHCDQSMHQ